MITLISSTKKYIERKENIMLFNVKITVTNSDNKEIFSKESKIENSFFRDNKKLDAKFIKCYVMSHNNRKEKNYRQFDELTQFSVFLNTETSNIISLDSVINDAVNTATIAEKSLDDAKEVITSDAVKTATLSKKQQKKSNAKDSIERLKAAQAKLKELSA